jgi:cyclic pyranopterin phosphate synthase
MRTRGGDGPVPMLVTLRRMPPHAAAAPPSGPQAEVAPPRAAAVLVDPQQRRVEYLRLSLTDRCNYRCTYCMPETGVDHVARAELLDFAELERLVRAFVSWGVRRVRLTGGEPTVRRGLPELVARLSAIELPAPPGDTGAGAGDGAGARRRLEVVMTTNGERLAELARPLADAGLARVTVSLDSRDPRRFAAITRRGRLDRVLAGIAAARAAGLGPVGVNTVAIAGFNADELGALAQWCWAEGHVPRFIEQMPMAGGALFVPGEHMPAAAIREAVAAACGGEVVPDAARGQGIAGAGPATYWRVVGGPHAGERFGLIAPLTENFCAGCNRLRVSATGQLHACLAYDDAGDLRRALRSGEPGALEAAVRAAVGAKRAAHGFDAVGGGGPRKAMVSIGG